MILYEGLVVKSTGSRYTVKSDDVFYECRIKGKLRIKGIRTTNPLTVGDIVDFEIQNETSEGGLPMVVITSLHPRKKLYYPQIGQPFERVAYHSVQYRYGIHSGYH
jgi:putative ribosome biogenesis GTPase RsgA